MCAKRVDATHIKRVGENDPTRNEKQGRAAGGLSGYARGARTISFCDFGAGIVDAHISGGAAKFGGRAVSGSMPAERSSSRNLSACDMGCRQLKSHHRSTFRYGCSAPGASPWWRTVDEGGLLGEGWCVGMKLGGGKIHLLEIFGAFRSHPFVELGLRAWPWSW